jgi:hypothetical protein
MTINMPISLAQVLWSINDLPWDYALYIPIADTSWTEDMKCMVLDPETTNNPDDDPDEAKSNGLKYALTIGEVQDVVENIKAQKHNAEIGLIIKALNFFYENDAFIDLSPQSVR